MNLTMSWSTYSSYCQSKGNGWSMAWFDKKELVSFSRYLASSYEYMVGAERSLSNDSWGRWIQTKHLIYSNSFPICNQNSSGGFYVTLRRALFGSCLNELVDEAKWICKKGKIYLDYEKDGF